MKIVILDAFTANPGDLSWEGLKALGEVEIHERTAPEEVISRCAGAEIVLTNKALVPAEAIEALPDLKYIGVVATGVNVVDLDAAKEAGVVVTNVPGYSTDSVAQLSFALILELASRVGDHSRAVADGVWEDCADFSFTTSPIVELSGKQLGIIGFGAIGQATAKVAAALGMKVVVYNRTREKVVDFPYAPLDEVIATSDVVSLHCPLTPETDQLMNADRLASMKEGAWLINTSRGPLVDEAALADSLNSGHLGGAGLDVLCKEPMAKGNPLRTAKNCLITPHIAWATREARVRLIDQVVANISAWQADKPLNVVNA
ncbi:MAG: D-2-hydroxyacid dehydrogenase [Verrucomicrobiales bacterium]|nr:D-2-hydroxyacid dehydrogenase [Verrucomicrobiales bacterium]